MITTTKPAPKLGTGTGVVPRARRPLRTWIIAIAAYAVAVLFLLPYLEMLIMALRPNKELGLATILPEHWTFSNFTTLWSSGLGGSIGTSLEIAAGATAIVLLVALPAAYCTARRKFRGRTAFLLLVLATQMFQPAAMLVGIQREFTNFGLPPTMSLLIVNAGFNLAFAVWILNAYFSSIPVELEEASMVDGLGRIGALARITLPLAAPGIVTALIFTFIAAWNEFLVALTLSLGEGTAQQPLTVAINNYIGEYSIDWGHLFAAGLVATVPVIILFAFIERRVVSGLTAGAVK
ncbi:MAG: carbohydrate ABC transporter permease [Trebonia sp.]